MKKLFKLLSFVLLVAWTPLLTSCGSDDPVTPSGGTEEKTELEEQARPTDWVVVSEGIDLQSTMIADVEVDLSALDLTYVSDSQDMMAAYIDGTCRAVATCVTGNADADGNEPVVFPLTIKKLETDKADAQITLKLYSARLKHVFTASQTFSYVADGMQGTMEEPYKPQWTK